MNKKMSLVKVSVKFVEESEKKGVLVVFRINERRR